jgi:hypothetical protein
MAYQSLIAIVHELCATMDAFGALGAELHRRHEKLSIPTAVHELPRKVVEGSDTIC